MSVKQVEDPVMLKYLQLYSESQKQFFVAIDKSKSNSDDRKIPDIIRDAIRLKLLRGYELLGRPWNEIENENQSDDEKQHRKEGEA